METEKLKNIYEIFQGNFEKMQNHAFVDVF